MTCPYSRPRQNPITHKIQMTDCGKCAVCRVKNRIPWEYRLYHELKKNDYSGCFVTMTYSDDKYDVRKGLCYDHIRQYYDQLRKDGLHFSYYTVGEYGENTARCHWHSLMFGIPINARHLLFKRWSKWCYEPLFTVAPITTSRIRYCLKYMDKESCSNADWTDSTSLHNFEFLLDSARLVYNCEHVERPRAYMSKGLGMTNFYSRFGELYENGKFKDGFKRPKPSKYQIDCLSRSDVFFQCRRDRFLDESDSYNKALIFYGSDYNVQNASLHQSVNFLQSLQKEQFRSGEHSRIYTDLEFDRSFANLKFNFDDDFKREFELELKTKSRRDYLDFLAMQASFDINNFSLEVA